MDPPFFPPKVQRQFDGEKTAFQQMVLEPLDINMQKKKKKSLIYIIYPPHIKINSKWTTVQNVKPKTIKLLEKKMNTKHTKLKTCGAPGSVQHVTPDLSVEFEPHVVCRDYLNKIFKKTNRKLVFFERENDITGPMDLYLDYLKKSQNSVRKTQ